MSAFRRFRPAPGIDPSPVAAKTATFTIAIVFAIATDPVESGIVQGLARPDPNVTGFGNQSLELIAKRLQQIAEQGPMLVPGC